MHPALNEKWDSFWKEKKVQDFFEKSCRNKKSVYLCAPVCKRADEIKIGWGLGFIGLRLGYN